MLEKNNDLQQRIRMIAEEGKLLCIHCNEPTDLEELNDGLCKGCKTKGFPGHNKKRQREKRLKLFYRFLEFIVPIGLVLFIFKLASWLVELFNSNNF